MTRHRAALAARVLALRQLGYLYREIGEQMGIAASYAKQLGADPDGAKARARDPDGAKRRARQATYGRPCVDCGKTTDGSNGRAKAPERCESCYRLHIEPPHGTASRYRGRGCRCDLCREANTIDQRQLVGRMPPRHGASGYVNFHCRCDVCKAAGSAKNRARRDRHKAAAS